MYSVKFTENASGVGSIAYRKYVTVPADSPLFNHVGEMFNVDVSWGDGWPPPMIATAIPAENGIFGPIEGGKTVYSNFHTKITNRAAMAEENRGARFSGGI
jgi:hypothetical protein